MSKETVCLGLAELALCLKDPLGCAKDVWFLSTSMQEVCVCVCTYIFAHINICVCGSARYMQAGCSKGALACGNHSYPLQKHFVGVFVHMQAMVSSSCPAEMKKEESTFRNGPCTFPLPLPQEKRSYTKALTLSWAALTLSRAKGKPASPGRPPTAMGDVGRRMALTPALCWVL